MTALMANPSSLKRLQESSICLPLLLHRKKSHCDFQVEKKSQRNNNMTQLQKYFFSMNYSNELEMQVVKWIAKSIKYMCFQ